MKKKIVFCMGIIACFGLLGCGPDRAANPSDLKADTAADKPRGPVEVGDSLVRVKKALGHPRVEFPDGDHMVHWFSEYQVVTSNQVVIAVNEL